MTEKPSVRDRRADGTAGRTTDAAGVGGVVETVAGAGADREGV